MKTKRYLKYYFTAIFIILMGTQIQTAQAQSVDLGADFVNRYIWRGYDFGNSASIQPYIEFSTGGFTLGTWADYAISPVQNGAADAIGATEHDIYAGYSFGAVSIGVTDYFFPAGSDFFDFDNDGEGAHIIEPNISITGGESFPITFYAAINAYNDPDNSVYLQASIPFSLGDTDMSLTVGGVPTSGEADGPGYYGNSKAAVTNINFSASHAVKISDRFSLPIFASYILNPYEENSYLLFGFSL